MSLTAVASTMFRMTNFLMALSLGTHRAQLVQRIGCTWQRPFLARPLFLLFLVILEALRRERSSMGFSRQEYWSGVPSPSPFQYIRQMLITIKGETESNTIIMRDFNIPLTPINMSPSQKIKKETQALKDTLDIIDIHRAFYPKTMDFIFF